MEITDLISMKKLQNMDPMLYSQVLEVYNNVKDTINGISGCFSNFTMHDIGHSLRVATYMEQLAFGIEDNFNEKIDLFNAAELAILVLSALLHDIGMFISDKDREEIKKGIIKYSDKVHYKGVLEVKNGDENEAIKEIVRLTHARRINEYLNDENTANEKNIANILKIDNKYSYAEDIALICMSHGEDYKFIKNSLRTSVNKGKYEFNQQYFAVLLRIADYLDLDRQRTPMLWFSTMGIEGFSRTEWETHFQISNEKKIKMHFDGKMQIYFDGKSSNAKIHRKYLKYIDNVKKEIEDADFCLNHKETPEKYRLNLTNKIDDLVQTEGFKYSDLRLSLDYAAITELLMGKHIYGDKKLGLRELIQNSIDACKIMKETDSELVYSLEPKIMILLSKEKGYVKIKDFGIGMTMDIVKNHFLNVGKSYYKSDEFLFNDFKYKPIGQYGIGFLACFLLSDTIKVNTRHYNSTELCKIELEKDSEYVVTNTVNSSMFYGTEIQLEYAKFMEVFKSSEELKEFISTNFYTDITIEVIDEDISKNPQIISNKNSELLKKICKANSNNKYETINCKDLSDLMNGEILIKKEREEFKEKIESLRDKKIMIYDPINLMFYETKEIEKGYYNYFKYANISLDEYNKIKKSKKSFERRLSELIALGETKSQIIYLLIKDDNSFPYPYFYYNDKERYEKINKIFENSKLNYYEEFFMNDHLSYIYLKNNEFIHLYNVSFTSRYRFFETYADDMPHYISLFYYKDILVGKNTSFSTLLPYPYSCIGYINYLGKDIRLTVSRKEISDGYENVNKEYAKIMLKFSINKEKNSDIKLFLEEMLKEIK